MGCLTGRVSSMRVNKPINIVDVEVTKDGNFSGWVLLQKCVDLIGDHFKNLAITGRRSVQEEKKKVYVSERCNEGKVLMPWILGVLQPSQGKVGLGVQRKTMARCFV